MKNSNYALIIALYANKLHRGLYSDIYFPIIRYSLLKIFSQRKEEYPYSSAECIQSFIKDKFGITIPTIVIANAIRKIYNSSACSIQLKVFEKGNRFQIQRVSNDDSIDIEKEENVFDRQERNIEERFKEYINKEGIVDDGITFVEFISSNTDNLLSYFESENEKSVDEKYYSLVEFLRFLHNKDESLYQIANKFFWGSIIAAFLQSDKPSVNASTDNGKIEYFLDTPVIMGILGLSTPEKEHYSKELRETIQSAQGILRVHPLTLEEIKSIILSVEQNGANPFSDIAVAVRNHKLNVIGLAQIRVNIENYVEKAGISIIPPIRPEEIENIKSRYRGSKRVVALAKQRSHGIESYSRDGFREIHDIFMDDFIGERQSKKKDFNHIYFVTNNTDLIVLCKSFHQNTNHMVSISRLILDLWMYNTRSTDVSDVALVEVMAKCIDAHKIDVKNKLAVVSRYYNQSKGNFDQNVYNDFIRQLYRRAKNVIDYVKTADEIDSSDYKTWSEGLMSAISNDMNAEHERRRQTEIEKAGLKAEIEQKTEAIKNAKEKERSLLNEKQLLQHQNDLLQQKMVNLVDGKNKLEKERESLKADKENQSLKIEQLKHKLELKEELVRLKDTLSLQNADLESYDRSREKSFINWPAHILLFIFILGSVICILHAFGLVEFNLQPVFALIAAPCLTGSIAFYSKPNICNRKNKALEKWERKPENKKYKIVEEQIKKTNEKIKQVEEELRNYD